MDGLRSGGCLVNDVHRFHSAYKVSLLGGVLDHWSMATKGSSSRVLRGSLSR